MESAIGSGVGAKSRPSITRQTVDLSGYPDLVVIYLGMRVLNVNDVGFLTPAGALYMVYQVEKETLAGLAP